MEIQLPSGCGNAPRVGIVNDFVAYWATADVAALAPQLVSEGTTWVVNGSASTIVLANAATVCPKSKPVRLEIRSTITHGKLAACEGTLHTETVPIDFCHIITFTAAGKTAKIASIRTFRAESSSV